MKMKAVLILVLNLVIGMTCLSQQPTQTKEYCTVYMKVFYQGNRIYYDEKGLSKSPVITMPDGKQYFAYDAKKQYSDKENGQFIDVGQLLNAFAGYGWELKSSNILNYDAGDRSTASAILSTDQYFQILIFEKPVTVGAGKN